jgi:Concanavalin A-like lectin/glucanases superfamily
MQRIILTTLVATGIALAPAAAAQAAVVASWQMDEASGATTMKDSASLGGTNNGAIHNVRTGVPGLAGGRAYQFGGATSYVEVPDDAALDPGAADITLSATIKADNIAMPDDSYDLVRKGVTTTAGGDWKMEIHRAADPTVGRLLCVFKGVVGGSMVAVQRNASVDVIDGAKHTLKCVKTATKVTAIVDGKSFSTTKAAGSIANDQPVIVGAKSASDDVLQGVLDAVTVNIG